MNTIVINRKADINNAARAALFAFVESLEKTEGFTGIKPMFRWNLMDSHKAETKYFVLHKVLPCFKLNCRKDLKGLFISALCRAYEKWEEKMNAQPVKMIWWRLPEEMWTYESRLPMIQNNPPISCGRPYFNKIDSVLVQFHYEELPGEYDAVFNEHIVPFVA